MLIAIGTLWLSILLLGPVYIRPGNGSLECGRSWRAESIEDFLEPACHRAIVHRRVVMLLPAGAITLGLTALVVARRPRQPTSG